jgi:phosphomannomutase
VPAFNPAALRAYDIRGVVGRDLDAGDARALGLAYAALARARGLRRIAVQRDGRLSSPWMEEALVAGLLDGGMAVTRIGLGPTPKLAFAVRTLGLDGGVMVTASHNPPDENGFKLLLGEERIHGAGLRAMVSQAGPGAPGGALDEADVSEAYVERLAEAAAGLPAFTVAWDSGAGATGPTVEALVARLPGRHVTLHTTVDGRFPAHHPDPAVEANLGDVRAAVAAEGCDLGLAFDGDGDRIGVVDGEGAVLWADQHLLFLAGDVLRERPGAAIVADVKSSRVLFDGVRALGGRPVMAPSGYVRVQAAMRDAGAVLGGELSGHIFYADRWHGVDDAVYVAVRTLCALAASGASLADFRRSLPATVYTPELRIACPDGRKAAVVGEVGERLEAEGAAVDRADGLRVETADGWWLLRASGTEPKLTCRCEAADAAGWRDFARRWGPNWR